MVTMPFLFEGNDRIMKAVNCMEYIRESKVELTVYNNQSLMEECGDIPINQAFMILDEKIAAAVLKIYEKIDKNDT